MSGKTVNIQLVQSLVVNFGETGKYRFFPSSDRVLEDWNRLEGAPIRLTGENDGVLELMSGVNSNGDTKLLESW